MIRRAASDHKALEDSRMIRRSEETCRSSEIGCYHVRLVEAEGVHDAKNKLSHSLRRSDIFSRLGETKWRQVHRGERTQRREHVPCWEEGQNAFGQRAKKKDRVAVFLVVDGKADL